MHENSPQSTETYYAQLVSSVISQYDATLIFYQVKPIQKNKDDIQAYRSEPVEIARITIPHKTLVELGHMLSKQISTIEKGGEDETINKLNKKKK